MGKTKMASRAGSGAVYCMGYFGAAVYYISSTEGFWMGVLGLLKAIIWPGFLVYEMFYHLMG